MSWETKTSTGAGAIGLADLLNEERSAALSATHQLRATGFNPLDEVLSGGLAPEELVIVGGRPGIGKSVALVQWARNLARAGNEVVLACYEHSELVVMAQLLLIEIGGLVTNSIESVAARGAVDRLISRRASWNETLAADPIIAEAAARLDAISERITVLDRSGRTGGYDTLLNATHHHSPDVVMVDHLQRIDGNAASGAEFCKQLAVDSSATVVAAATTTDGGIADQRLRQPGLIDAAVLGHESDIEILLNDKLSIVSRNHSAFDSVRADEFRNHVVFSIEKNRRGNGDVDLEFTRDFGHRRFHTTGGFVTERLVDHVLVRE